LGSCRNSSTSSITSIRITFAGRPATSAALEHYRQEAEGLPSLSSREEQIADADRKLAEFDPSFVAGTADYARKLYLIEGCLYGVDIQPIGDPNRETSLFHFPSRTFPG
jgi:hypothetical protein